MAKYIDKERFREVVHRNIIGGYVIDQLIDAQPIADVRQIVHAHWIYGYTFPDGQYKKCSECKELIKVVANDGNFCGHCGAKMDDE